MTVYDTAPQGQNDPAAGPRYHILVADEDPLLRHWLMTTLVGAGYEAGEAESGPQVLEVCRRRPPDLVLLDAGLPGVDGFEACARLNADPACAAVPVVVMAPPGEEAVRRAFGAGAAEFIAKPLNPMLLLHRVRRLLGHSAHRRQAEADRAAAEEAIALRDRFVALVAHDLRSPLTSVLGLVGVVLEDDRTVLAGEHRELLQTAHDSGLRLVTMIEELLNIGRIQSGQLAPDPDFLDARHLAAEIVRRLEPNATAKAITLENEVPEYLRLYADRMMLGEVLHNLIGNAVKFSHPGGRVRVFAPEGRPATLAVADRGVGIAEECRRHLFLLEEKNSTLGTAGERGTGFGLPFSFDIMRAHGGGLTVESAPGAGSTFYASFPVVRPRVLVVDDERADRVMMAMMLEPLDVAVTEAAGAHEALELAPSLAPHLIVCDILMPEMDGLELLERLRAEPVTAAVPIIVVTADDHLETRERAFRLGADDFIVKPVSAADLIPRVRRIIQ